MGKINLALKLGESLIASTARYTKVCGKKSILETSASIFGDTKNLTYAYIPKTTKVAEAASKSKCVQGNIPQQAAKAINLSFEEAKLAYSEQVDILSKQTAPFLGKIRPRFNEKQIAELAPLMHEEPEIFNYLLNEKRILPQNTVPRFSYYDIKALIQPLKTDPALTREIIKSYDYTYGKDIEEIITSINKNKIKPEEFLKFIHKTRHSNGEEIHVYSINSLKYLVQHMQEYSMIKDKTILEEVDKIIFYGDSRKADALINATNNITGNYCTLSNKMRFLGVEILDSQENYEFARYLRSKGITLEQFEDGKIPGNITQKLEQRKIDPAILVRDFQLDCKYRSMNRYIKMYPKDAMTNYLYETYYLPDLRKAGVKEQVIERCQEINQKYNIKIMPSTESLGPLKTIDAIEAEIQKWVQASNRKAKLPPVIEFSTANRSWYSAESAYGKSASGGYSEPYYNGAIALPRMVRTMIINDKSKTLRHEMTHTNDFRPSVKRLQKKYNLDEIMPYHEGVNQNGRAIRITEPEKGKYYQEFINAGLNDRKVSYAYNNQKEFIAVACEGDISKYSPEFKQVLMDFGMPEWLFKIEG